jgi:cell division protein FtsW
LTNLLVLGLAILAAWAPLRHRTDSGQALLGVARELAPLWGVFLLVHAALAARRIQTDEYLLPLLSLLVLIGGLFHLGLDGAGGGAIRTYRADVLIGAVVAGGVVLLAGSIRRVGMLFEERVWWRVARDVPYYPSVPFHLALIGLLVAALILWLLAGGRAEGGALVRVPLFGGQSFTPSEFIRLAFAFFLAQYLAANARVLRNLRQPLGRFFPLNRVVVVHWPELATIVVMLALYGIFFFALRDLGPAAIIFVLTLLCLYTATNLGLTPLLLLGAGVFGATYLLGHGSSLFAERVAMWRDPWNTSFVHGDHLARMLWGVASGGPFGIGAGTVHLRPLLPEAARDTAFPAIATTMGMWSGLALLLLFAALTWRGLIIALRRPDDEGRLLAFSLTALLTLEAVWITAAGVGMLPLSGIDLPFVSTGLSSMLACCIALGALLNLSRDEGYARAAGTRMRAEVKPALSRLSSPVPQPSVTDAPLRRLSYLLTAAYALPAAGLIVYGTPFVLGDRILMRTASAVGRRGERTTFTNPYLDRFRAQFDRGGIYTRDGQPLAVTETEDGSRRTEVRRTPGHGASSNRRLPTTDYRLPARVYPFGAAAAQLVGWNSGGRFEMLPDAVETAYDGPLRGYQERDLPRLFRQRDNPVTRRHWPRPHDVYLTLDGKLQRYASLRLRAAIRQARGSGGAALVMDAGTGEVLAAVSEPSFDPNGLSVDRMKRLLQADRGRGLLLDKPLSPSARFFPGSTFKLVTAAAALRHPVEGTAYCNGANLQEITWAYHGIRYRRRPGSIHDFSRGGHGHLSLESDLGAALTESCNVFFATLAAKLGPETLREEMERCQLSHVPSDKELASYLPEAGFGQIVVKVAPVEMVRIAAAAGVARLPESQAPVPQPYWVKSVKDADGRTLGFEDLPGAPRAENFQPFDPPIAHRIRAMMLGVANAPRGTAYHAFHDRGGGDRLSGITIGGKTGTAELDLRVRTGAGRGRQVRRQHAWFVGFAQKESEVPVRTLAFAVLVENLGGRQTGGQVCAPVARDLVAEVLTPSPVNVTPHNSLLGQWLDQGRSAVEGWLRAR